MLFQSRPGGQKIYFEKGLKVQHAVLLSRPFRLLGPLRLGGFASGRMTFHSILNVLLQLATDTILKLFAVANFSTVSTGWSNIWAFCGCSAVFGRSVDVLQYLGGTPPPSVPPAEIR